MVKVKGIGYAGKHGTGRVLSRKFNSAIKWMEKADNFSAPFGNYSRLDAASKSLCNAVANALGDASVTYGSELMSTGILGCNKNGCSSADWNYYTDYVENGRKLGRGNYFIYTLPSSPLAEASIHFGLTGPLLYTSAVEAPLLWALNNSSVMNFAADSMLTGIFDEEAALFFYIDNACASGDSGIDIDVIIKYISDLGDLSAGQLIDRVCAWAEKLNLKEGS